MHLNIIIYNYPPCAKDIHSNNNNKSWEDAYDIHFHYCVANLRFNTFQQNGNSRPYIFKLNVLPTLE